MASGPLGEYNMTGENAIPQGATWPVHLGYSVDDILFDFTSYTGKMQVRHTYGSPVLLELTTSNGGIDLGVFTVEAVDYNIRLNFSAAFTGPMTHYKDMIWDVEFYGPTSDVIKFVSGRFELKREVTL